MINQQLVLKKVSKPKSEDIVTVTCYNETKTWERKKAIDFFWEGACSCEGHERDRYLAIVQQLKEGKITATDAGV